MRPQDLYPGIGALTNRVAGLADELAIARVDCETWDPAALRVDAGSGWDAAETHAAVVDDLAGAEEALRLALGRLEAAWSALGRLAGD